MTRPIVGTLLLGLAVWTAGPGGGQVPSVNPHVDLSVIPGSCVACHRGHGVSGSPMLPSAQVELCLECHGTRADFDGQVREGVVNPGTEPILLGSLLEKPYPHALQRELFSEHDTGVTCTSCHSAHRSIPPAISGTQRQRRSPKNPNRFEFELCLSCHGDHANLLAPVGSSDIGRLVGTHNPSYHPIKARSLERSPSLDPELTGREINCTDCHGNDDRTGSRCLLGSNVAGLLSFDYVAVDGAPESGSTYYLCYRCHIRDLVLSEASPFPVHALHVVEERTSCATCHNPHGSTDYRALIRFGEHLESGVVSPSASGVLGFESLSSGSGSCSLTCHGRNHDPEAYGIDQELLKLVP